MDGSKALHLVSRSDVSHAQKFVERSLHGPDRDREVARHIVTAVRELNIAMEEAVKAGMIVEPSLLKATNRFGDLGVAEESHILKVNVFLKLC